MLTDQTSHEDFEAITPEVSIYGHEMPALSVIPQLDSDLAVSFTLEHDHSHETLLKQLKIIREAKKEVEKRQYTEI